MQSKRFADAIKMICGLASVEFMKAVIETGYTDELYEKGDYESI